jgi:hypothetical protein
MIWHDRLAEGDLEVTSLCSPVTLFVHLFNTKFSGLKCDVTLKFFKNSMSYIVAGSRTSQQFLKCEGVHNLVCNINWHIWLYWEKFFITHGADLAVPLLSRDLSGNSLTGPMPIDLMTKLKWLRTLKLSNNYLSGNVTGNFIQDLPYLVSV